MADILCPKCGQLKPSESFRIYPNTGRPASICKACDSAAHRARRAARYGGNYAEARRAERRAAAEKKGREFHPRGPRMEYERLTRMRQIERGAEELRNRVFMACLRQMNSMVQESANGKYRKYYHSHLGKARAKTAKYKASHPVHVSDWGATRKSRISKTDDGTLTKQAIIDMKAVATHCAYCGKLLGNSEKQTDHMIPLCHGGEHSVRNVVIVCRSCNERKASLTFQDWINRIEPEYRPRLIGLWIERFGTKAA